MKPVAAPVDDLITVWAHGGGAAGDCRVQELSLDLSFFLNLNNQYYYRVSMKQEHSIIANERSLKNQKQKWVICPTKGGGSSHHPFVTFAKSPKWNPRSHLKKGLKNVTFITLPHAPPLFYIKIHIVPKINF